jgi:threonine/homoserine/homoserine lactone efflux protein
MNQIAMIAAVTWLAVLSPGADFAVVSRNSCLYGRRAGLASSVGISIACWFHVAYAVFGIAVLQRIAPDALGMIRFAGAGYLAYVGVSTALRPAQAFDAGSGVASRSIGRDLANGILTNGLNPKTSIFVVSLYSQFIGRDSSLAYQLAWGLFISLSHLGWFSVVAVFLSRPGVRRAVMRRQGLFNGIIGVVLVALGLSLLVLDLGGRHGS